ncbi:ferric-chelate reductase 1-like [Lineus longissimus]|uniref:ferric-chelate reductase 1-like n=1 Tax=Lineus longissimus TaxID=88925 RepID=UPI002B4F6190
MNIQTLHLLGVLLGVATILIQTGDAFPFGGPPKTCAYLLAKHGGTEPQVIPAPYALTVTNNPSNTAYNPNDILTVTLNTTSDVGFKGFIMRAYRITGDVEDNLGEFMTWPDTAIPKYWYPDQGGPNCVTHKSSSVKKEVTVTWKAPAKSVGDIIFSVGVVLSYKTFWSNISSSIIRANKPSAENAFLSTVSLNFAPIDMKECGKTKGCLLYPRTCSGENCEYGVTYKDEGDTILFEMFGITDGYISLGMSYDKLMGDDATMACTGDNVEQYVSVQNGYNPAYQNERHRIVGITDIQMTRNGATLYCRFRRPKVMTYTTLLEKRTTTGDVLVRAINKTFDFADDFYLFFAWGHLYLGTDVLGKHRELPVITDEAVDFQEAKIHYGQAIPLMIQLHATFMLVAWMALAGFGIVISRHFKNVFTKFVCGSQRWFQIHRWVMFALYTLTMVSMVLIIAYIQGWTKIALLHSIFGMIAISLSTLQVVAGLLRPDPSSKHRPAYNWLHRIFGQISHVCAAVAMMLAYNVTLLPAFVQKWGFIVTAVWIGFQVLWEIIFEIIKCCNDSKRSKYMADEDDNIKKSQPAPGEKLAKKVAFVFYTLTLFTFLGASISFLYIY